MEQNNAARRLYNILQLAISRGDAKNPTYYALAQALDIKDPDIDKYIFTDFFVLLNDVEVVVSQLKKVTDLDEWINTIREIKSIFVYSMFQVPWSDSVSQLKSQGLIRNLIACANFIDHEQVDPSLSEEQLQKYLQECENLLQELMDSDLPEDIKVYLVIRLEEICSAIRQYSLGGPERLRKVVEANLGGILLRHAGISQKDKEKPILIKVFGWLLTFGGVLDLGANTQGYLLPKVAEITRYFLAPGQ
jgi:hypothetical protein